MLDFDSFSIKTLVALRDGLNDNPCASEIEMKQLQTILLADIAISLRLLVDKSEIF